jgi:hypothetical protein
MILLYDFLMAGGLQFLFGLTHSKSPHTASALDGFRKIEEVACRSMRSLCGLLVC